MHHIDGTIEDEIVITKMFRQIQMQFYAVVTYLGKFAQSYFTKNVIFNSYISQLFAISVWNGLFLNAEKFHYICNVSSSYLLFGDYHILVIIKLSLSFSMQFITTNFTQ